MPPADLEVLVLHAGRVPLCGRRAVPGGWVYIEYAYNLDGDHFTIAGVATCFVPDGMAPHVRGEPPTTEAPA